MTTPKEVKIGYFGPFEADNLWTSRWKVLFSKYFCLIGKKNISTTSFKNLYLGFRATLNLWKNDASLKPIYRFFSNLVHFFIMFVKQKYIKFKIFHKLVLKLLASKGWKKGRFGLFWRCHGIKFWCQNHLNFFIG